jgi:hypothetical protein
MEIEQGLSKKAEENLSRNAQLRKQEGRFINLDPEETTILQFNAEKIEPVEREFDGKTYTRYQYVVINHDGQEKIFESNSPTSRKIDLHLLNGNTMLEIQRLGSGKQTRYTINPR